MLIRVHADIGARVNYMPPRARACVYVCVCVCMYVCNVCIQCMYVIYVYIVCTVCIYNACIYVCT